MSTGGHYPHRFNQGDVEEEEAAAGRRILETDLPNVLVTNDDGINAPGLRALVAALLADGSCDVFICAPESEKSAASHGVTGFRTLEVSSVNIPGTTAFETSGTPADCVALAITGSIFPWTKPTMVLSGINKGSNCGYRIFYSGAVAGAREANILGVPAISLSLEWKRGKSSDEDFKSAAVASLPLIKASLRDIQRGVFLKDVFLKIEIPSNPSEHKDVWSSHYKQTRCLSLTQNAEKGYKVTRQGTSCLPLKWKKLTQENRMQRLKDTGVGLQMAQLGLAASAAGAARRANFKKQNPDVESVGTGEEPDKHTSQKLHFRLEGTAEDVGETAPDHDLGALEQGYISVTAVSLDSNVEINIRGQVEDWVASVAAVAPPSAVQYKSIHTQLTKI